MHLLFVIFIILVSPCPLAEDAFDEGEIEQENHYHDEHLDNGKN